MLWVALQFPALPSGTLEQIAAWACRFTPKVSLEPPYALLAEVEGSLRYFRGVDGLQAALREGLAALGCEASLAVAGTPRAALWHARDPGKSFGALSLGVLDDAPAKDFLERLGIRTLGELMALPREGLARRCGQGVLDELDRALGTLPESRAFFSPPARFDATLELPGAVMHAEGVLLAARRLLVRLEGLLAARQQGLRAFSLMLKQHRNALEVNIRLASATRDPERLARLLGEKLSILALREPVESIRLRAADFEPLHPHSRGLFGDARAEGEAWAQLVERLQGRLGAGAIHGVTPQPDHRPEHAWRRVEPGEWDPREFVQPGPRPAWLLPAPRRVAREALDLLAGPERIECGWWDGDDMRRDYFIARSGASLAWVYREPSGEWFIHGLFA